jgi:Zn-dependent protease with chaperone function
MTRSPFAGLLVLSGLGVALLAALVMAAFPSPMREAFKRCAESSGLCLTLVHQGGRIGGPLLLALLLWSFYHGAITAWGQWRATRSSLARLGVRGMYPPEGKLEALCSELELQGTVTVIATATPLALCCGLWRPCIWVSTGTLDLLEPAELAAVLRHERAHLRRRHPLQLLVARSLAAAFSFLPVLGELAEALPRAQELAADRTVIRAGGRHALGRALLALVDAQRGAPPVLLAPGMVGALDARLDQLAGLETAPARLSRPALLCTWLVFGAGLLLLRLGTLDPAQPHTLLSVPSLRLANAASFWRSLIVPTLLCGVVQVAKAARDRFHR